jgi:hypothetical protein
MQLPEPTQALCQQWQLGNLELVGQALLALTAFGKGEGQLLLWDGKSFVTVVAARNGEWDERLIGRISDPSEEPFAFKALRSNLAPRTPHFAHQNRFRPDRSDERCRTSCPLRRPSPFT